MSQNSRLFDGKAAKTLLLAIYLSFCYHVSIKHSYIFSSVWMKLLYCHKVF